MNWKIVVRALSPLGYITDLARDGQEAITMIQQHDYTVILMDVHMPQMDGLEATRRIRELAPPKSEIPIIALTASVLNEEQQIYLDAGMNAFLGKPFSIEQLRKTVQHWSNHSSGT
jgi:CheY-like chemotaxis protein